MPDPWFCLTSWQLYLQLCKWGEREGGPNWMEAWVGRMEGVGGVKPAGRTILPPWHPFYESCACLGQHPRPQHLWVAAEQLRLSHAPAEASTSKPLILEELQLNSSSESGVLPISQGEEQRLPGWAISHAQMRASMKHGRMTKPWSKVQLKIIIIQRKMPFSWRLTNPWEQDGFIQPPLKCTQLLPARWATLHDTLLCH